MLELRYLKNYIVVDEDGLIRPNVNKSRPVEELGSDFVSIEQTLDLVSVGSWRCFDVHSGFSAMSGV